MIPFIYAFEGIRIHVDETMGLVRKQIRFPRSKGKRIRKKWRKNPANWVIYYDEGPEMFHVKPPVGPRGPLSLLDAFPSREFIMCNPPAYAIIQEEIAKWGKSADPFGVL